MICRILAAALLALTLSCGQHKPQLKSTPVVAVLRSPLEQQHAATHRIAIYDVLHGETGHCSGTAISKNAVLTAQHCFKDSNLIRLDKEVKPVKIIFAFVDGNDHVIYVLDHSFSTWVPIQQKPLVPLASVHFWGAPGKNSDVYRTGYFSSLGIVPDISKTLKLQAFILPTFHGDSGSGIFDDKGNVVAVVSLGDTSANEWSLPLAFTDEQLDAATK
jgi:hypothetical protein